MRLPSFSNCSDANLSRSDGACMVSGDLPATAMFLVHIFVIVFVFVIVIVNCSCSLLDISKHSEGGWLMYSEAGAWCCNVYGAFILLLFL